MELHIKQRGRFLQAVEKFIQPFLLITEEAPESMILPLYDLIRSLHASYVAGTELQIMYEYYNEKNRICLADKPMEILSVVRDDMTIRVKDLTNQEDLILSLEQILTVSANAA